MTATPRIFTARVKKAHNDLDYPVASMDDETKFGPVFHKLTFGEAITRDFGSFEKFRKQLTTAASTIMGSGWGALVWEPVGKRLVTTQIYDHQSNLTQAGIPVLVLDAWEHAYYLQYENRKTDFFEVVWNCWNWEDAAQRFEAVRKLDLAVTGATK